MEHENEMPYLKFTKRSRLEKTLTTLEGILKGIIIDGAITDSETKSLIKWCSSHSDMKKLHPFNEIFRLIDFSLADGVLDIEEAQDILWMIENIKSSSSYFTVIHQGIQELHGIIQGILADGKVEPSEVYGLQEWLLKNEHLQSCYPFDEINSIITSVLSDRIVDPEEQQLLKQFFEDFTGVITHDSGAILNNEKTSLLGVCAICPEIHFDGGVFCFTGFSEKMTRSNIIEIIESLGGGYSKNVIKALDYLVVGVDSNPCWTFSCYGRKVEQVMNLRKQGNTMIIVNEYDFWDSVEDSKIS